MEQKSRGNGTVRFYTFGPDTPEPESIESEEGMSEINYTKEVDEVENTMKKRLQWRWWLVTIIMTLIGAGFMASQHLTASYVRESDYRRSLMNHRETHKEVTSKIVEFEKILTGVRIEQAQNTERSKLINTRLELLLKRTDSEPRTHQERTKADRQELYLQKMINEQERRLRRLENDPRVKQMNDSDPFNDLSS